MTLDPVTPGSWRDVSTDLDYTDSGSYGNTVTVQDNSSAGCGNKSIPTALGFIYDLTPKRISLLVLYIVCTVITLALFIDETVFTLRHFRNKSRCHKTILVLAVFPVFSVTGLIGYMIPLAAPVVDLAANTFMAACLYTMLKLMINYLGGSSLLWSIISEGQLTVKFATLPVCCVFPCLPKRKLDRKLLRKLSISVLQVCIFRPLIMLIAAIMWADGSYNHGGLDPKTGDPYIAIINATTTLVAVFGLNLCKTAFVRPLERFLIGGKIFIVQMVLATCSLTPGITKLFERLGLVKCDPIYQQIVHLDGIYRGVLVISMLIYAIIGRLLYRRMSDANSDVTAYRPEPEADEDFKTQIINLLYIPRDIVVFLMHECCYRTKTADLSHHNQLDEDIQHEVLETEMDLINMTKSPKLRSPKMKNSKTRSPKRSPNRKQPVFFSDEINQNGYMDGNHVNENMSFSLVECSDVTYGGMDNSASSNSLFGLDLEDEIDREIV